MKNHLHGTIDDARVTFLPNSDYLTSQLLTVDVDSHLSPLIAAISRSNLSDSLMHRLQRAPQPSVKGWPHSEHCQHNSRPFRSRSRTRGCILLPLLERLPL